MAPSNRRKKSLRSPESHTPASPAPTQMPNSQIAHLSPSKSTGPRTPTKSPLRRVQAGAITKTQKNAMIANLNLEISERVRKLRAQYAAQARALKQRIEMRVNRVPKKLWAAKMGDLLVQSTMPKPANTLPSKFGPGGARGFVEEIMKISRGECQQKDKTPPLIIPKHRVVNKSPVRTARDQMPPPSIPTGNGLSLPQRNNFPPSSSQQRPTSPARPFSPIKSAKKPLPSPAKKIVPSGSSTSTRPISRSTTRSSLETAGTSAGSGLEEGRTVSTKSSQLKTRGASGVGTKKGGKGAGSTGSTKENKVAGVKEKASAGSKVTKKAAGGRILRSRK